MYNFMSVSVAQGWISRKVLKQGIRLVLRTFYAHTYHCSIYSTRVYNGKFLTQQVNTEL